MKSARRITGKGFVYDFCFLSESRYIFICEMMDVILHVVYINTIYEKLCLSFMFVSGVADPISESLHHKESTDLQQALRTAALRNIINRHQMFDL